MTVTVPATSDTPTRNPRYRRRLVLVRAAATVPGTRTKEQMDTIDLTSFGLPPREQVPGLSRPWEDPVWINDEWINVLRGDGIDVSSATTAAGFAKATAAADTGGAYDHLGFHEPGRLVVRALAGDHNELRWAITRMGPQTCATVAAMVLFDAGNTYDDDEGAAGDTTRERLAAINADDNYRHGGASWMSAGGQRLRRCLFDVTPRTHATIPAWEALYADVSPADTRDVTDVAVRLTAAAMRVAAAVRNATIIDTLGSLTSIRSELTYV
jgi:hypothetical protein